MEGQEIPFSLTEPRYDQSTFGGRLRHFANMIDPRTLLNGQSELDRCVRLLDEYKKGTIAPNVTDAELWHALKVKQATIHPDTGEKIFMPFRMSGFVVFGSPIVAGLLLPNQTFGTMIFWQWLNQTHNACVNYANRNASKPTPTSRFVLGYVSAVTCAGGIAVGLSTLIRRANKLSPAMKILIEKFVPFPAVAAASTCNVLLMRNSELKTGIDVIDSKGQVVGTSQIAARKALKETAMTRMILPAPILVIPPALMTLMEKTALLRRRPGLHLPLNALFCTLSFGFALPVAIALFPQYSTVPVSSLENEIQDNTSEEVVTYNKGL